MAPSCSVDTWSSITPNSRVHLDCLMPNGVLIFLRDVSVNATLQEIKEDLWEESSKYPLHGLLKEMTMYNFSCINSVAENEVLLDETRRLCDVKPFSNFLKVSEQKPDAAENTLNAHIGVLIGKGLHDFDALKLPEVNEFRWRMKTMVTEIVKRKERSTFIEKVQYQFPCEVASNEDLPNFLLPRLQDGNMVIGIQFRDHGSTTFSFSISHTTTPLQILAIALQKKSSLMGKYPFNPDSAKEYFLKVSGREEYLIGDFPLSRFLCIRDLLCKEIVPSLIVVHMDSVQSEWENPYAVFALPDPKRGSRNSFSTFTLRKKMRLLDSWGICEKFAVSINVVSRLNCEESEVGIQAGLFHGGSSLCEAQHTRTAVCAEGECKIEETLIFNLDVRDLPRMARLCLAIYTVSKMSKGGKHRRTKDSKEEVYMNPIAWANVMLYDYKSQLKTGAITLYAWTYAEDLQTEEILHPLGTVVSNPNGDQAASITLTFTSYCQDKVVVYPHVEKIEEIAGQQRKNDGSSTRLSVSGEKESMLYKQQLRYMAERDPLHEMHDQDRKTLWSLRYECLQDFPELLPKLLLCIEWNNHKEIAEMISLLRQWPRLPPQKALELLDFAYADACVRKYAIDCIRNVSDEELLLYLLQLVQALKHESYLECDLVDFLVFRALNNQRIGHFLFWHLRSEMHVPAVSVRFGLILEAYCRGVPDHMHLLMRQVGCLEKLLKISEAASQRKESREKLRQFVQEALKDNHASEKLSNILCPLDPALRCRELRVDKCKTMDSKMKPIWLVFENYDPFGKDVLFIFKHGDDLRQDMLTLQMIRIMDRLWKDAGLDLRMNPYGCISTGNKVGLIEIVLNAETIANIQKEKGTLAATSAFKKGSLLAWLKDHNPTETALNKAVEEFSLSCAGYSVATYVLGVADRHSDNIMVKKNGQLFHIDFGHILGHFKEKFGIRRERVPFVLTHDFVHVITKGQKEAKSEFAEFRKNCEQAFLILRKHGSLIISLFAMMISTGLPELNSEKELDYLRETLVLDLSEQEALRHFRSKFDEALRNSWKTSLNWDIHNMTKNNKQ